MLAVGTSSPVIRASATTTTTTTTVNLSTKNHDGHQDDADDYKNAIQSSLLSSSSSSSSYTNNDYTNGLKFFIGLFIVTPIVVWMILLLVFKFVYGKGCRRSTTMKKRRWFSRSSCRRHNRRRSDGRSITTLNEEQQLQEAITRSLADIHTDEKMTINDDDDDNNKHFDFNDEYKKKKTNNINDKTLSKKQNRRDHNNDNDNIIIDNKAPLMNPWIAGGDIIDMIELSKCGIPRPVRKQYVVRSWRIQSVYMLVAIIVPIMSVVLMEVGWTALEQSVRDIQTLNDDIETITYRGWNAMTNIEQTKEHLFTNNIIQLLLEYNNNNNITTAATTTDPPTGTTTTNNDNENYYDSELDRKSHNDYIRRRFLQQQGIKEKEEATASLSSSTEEIQTQRPTYPWDEIFGSSSSSQQQQEGTVSPTSLSSSSNTPLIKTTTTSSGSSDNDGKMSTTIFTDSDFNDKDSKNTMMMALSEKEKLTDDNTMSSSPQTEVITTTKGSMIIEEWCPNAFQYINKEELLVWTDSINILNDNTQIMNDVFNMYLGSSTGTNNNNNADNDFDMSPSAVVTSSSTNTTTHHETSSSTSVFQFVTETTHYIDDTIEWFFNNDWLLKLLLLVLNVVNALLLANVYILSKNNIIHTPTRMYVSYILIPIFVLATLSVLLICTLSGIAVLINVDFCSGGSNNNDMRSSYDGNADGGSYGSPQGTIEDVILTLQQKQQHDYNYDSGNAVNGNTTSTREALDIVYDAVGYFWNVRNTA